MTADQYTTISYSAFGVGAGSPWYVIDPITGFANTTGGALIIVKDPQLSVDVWDFSQPQGGIAVSGKSIIQGDLLGFKIGTNMDNAINQPTLRTNDTLTDVNYTMDIKVKTDSGQHPEPHCLTQQVLRTASQSGLLMRHHGTGALQQQETGQPVPQMQVDSLHTPLEPTRLPWSPI